MTGSQQSELGFHTSAEIAHRQIDLLRKHIAYVAEHSPFYRRRFEAAEIDPSRICAIDDLQQIPFTTKSDLEMHNSDFLCVDETEIVDCCQTSGTTGEPVVMLQTQSDLDRLGLNEQMALASCGITSRDRVIMACALGRNFMAGLAYFLGITKLGAMAIRTGSDSMPMIMDSIRRHHPTALVAVPSMALAMAKRFQANGETAADFGIRRIICIGEPVRNDDLSLSPLGQKLAHNWNASIFGTYASTETATAFCDCKAENGGHLIPELMVVEIVDEDGKPVPPGVPGEIVATPLGVTGMPILRLKTGDIAALHAESCRCGRNSIRLGPIVGRKSQMLKIRGCTVYPPAIINALHELPQIRGCYIEVSSDFELSDQVKVVVGSEDQSLNANEVAAHLAARVRVKPEVEVVTPEQVRAKTISSEKRKPTTFFDYRK